MGQITEKTIDIDNILKSKMGTKVKWVPGFLVSWLKRIAHQDEVNKFLWESRDKVGNLMNFRIYKFYLIFIFLLKLFIIIIC